MGYTTDFRGSFALDRPLRPEHKAYLEAFNETRRMRRDATKAEALPDPVRIAAGLPIGDKGAYFVGAGGSFGDARDESVLDYNQPPGLTGMDPADERPFNVRYGEFEDRRAALVREGKAQPGLWCQWRPNEDGTAIEWDEGEKFYEYIEWIEYLIDHFLKPWGYVLNGEVEWEGEESDDRGMIAITFNVVRVKRGRTVYDDEPATKPLADQLAANPIAQRNAASWGDALPGPGYVPPDGADDEVE